MVDYRFSVLELVVCFFILLSNESTKIKAQHYDATLHRKRNKYHILKSFVYIFALFYKLFRKEFFCGN